MRIVNPQARPRKAAVNDHPAARLTELKGRRLGVLINEPGSALITNWEGMSQQLQDVLAERQNLRSVHREIKPKMSAPAPPELIERLASYADAVVNGLGK